MKENSEKYEFHGGTHTRTYRIWWDVIRRCTDPKFIHFDRYGGRGIKVDPGWINSFSKFRDDMGEAPEKMTLERINNELGYSKGNCRWASRLEQSHNRCNNAKMTINGVTKPIAAWAKEKGLLYSLVYYRKQIAKWPDERCLEPEKQKPTRSLNYLGKTYSVKEIAEKLGISVTCIHLRIKAGWSVEDIINRPNSQPYKKPGWKFTHSP